MVVLQTTAIAQKSPHFEFLQKLLVCVAEKNKEEFISLCGEKFLSIEEFREFLKDSTSSAFVVDSNVAEQEHSRFINYVIATINHFWPNSWKPAARCFGKPSIDDEALRYQSFNVTCNGRDVKSLR